MKVAVKMTGLPETKAAEIKALFSPMLEQMEVLENDFNVLKKKKHSVAKSKEAKTLRMKFVKCRTNTAKIHKASKAYHLAANRALDGYKSAQEFAGKDLEKKLQEIENAEAERKRKEREFKLAEYGVSVYPPNLGEMEDQAYEDYLETLRAKYKAEKEKDLEIAKLRQKLAESQAAAVAPVQHVADTAGEDHVVDTTTGEILDPSKFAGAQVSEQFVKKAETDKEMATHLILDLNNLANKYAFESDQYSFAYGKMKEKFAAMEDYLRRLNKTQ